MLRTACHAIAAGPEIDLVLNVSPVQLAGADLPALVGTVLAQSGLAPGRLMLAMPDRVLAGAADRLQAGLAALKALGVRLAVGIEDPNATSMQHLRAAGFDEAKVERARVADADGDAAPHETLHELRQLIATLGDPVKQDGMPAASEWRVGLGPETLVRGLRVGVPLSSAALAGLRAGPSAPLARPRGEAITAPSARVTLPA